MTTAPTIHDTPKRYGTQAMTLAIAASLVFLICGQKAICRGLILGALFSTINFVLMAHTLQSKIRGERKSAALAALGNILFRFMFMAIPLYVAITLPRFDLVATIVGLFMIQSVILFDHISRNFLLSWRR